VPGRDRRLVNAPLAEPSPADWTPPSPEDHFLAGHPALAPVPERDPCLGNVP